MPEVGSPAATRYLALDHGSRRIGVAVADGATRMAFARPAMVTRSRDGALSAVAELARSEGASCIIIGLPMHADGREGAQAVAARSFAAELAERGFDVVLHDERLTSWEAREQLAASGSRPARRTGAVDSAAARLILQDFLDSKETR